MLQWKYYHQNAASHDFTKKTRIQFILIELRLVNFPYYSLQLNIRFRVKNLIETVLKAPRRKNCNSR